MTVNREPTADELNGVKQDTVHWPAKAHRVSMVDSDGNEITSSFPFNIVITDPTTGVEGTVNEEGRVDIVQHAHPNSVNAHMDLECTGGTTYNIILVDLSDTTNFKHTGTNYVHIENLAISIDAETNAAYDILFGWLENVDASDGDLYEFYHVHGSKQVGQNKTQTVYIYPNGPRLTSDSTITSDVSTNDTTYQTDVNLPTLLAPTTSNTPPGDGDFILKITSTGGANTDFKIDVTFSYHGH